MSNPPRQGANDGYVPEYVHFANHLRIPTPELLSKLVIDPKQLQLVSYKTLRERERGNFVVSPLLVQLILIGLRLGTEGETAEEIKRYLRHTEADRQTIKRASKALIQQLMDNSIYYFHPVNKIFVRSVHAVHRNYKILSEGVFKLYVELLNFKEPEIAREKINKYTRFQTTTTVENIVPPAVLTPKSNMVIASSVFFKAPWYVEIDREPTCKKMFRVTPDNDVEVDFIHTLSHFNFYESEKLKAKFLEINLVEETGSLVIVLPDEIDGLPYLEERLEEVLDLPFSTFTRQEFRVELPKYVIATSLDWKEPLKQLGIRKLFTENEAMISDIAGAAGDVHVDHLFQKILFRVNEEGVETTTVHFEQKEPPTSPLRSKTAKEFIVDHPFLFYVKIRDVTVFIGRLVNPSRPDEVR